MYAAEGHVQTILVKIGARNYADIGYLKKVHRLKWSQRVYTLLNQDLLP
jgi:hypothetical protein